ncbi:homoprotocatechuate degradation operon regulator HpaR [Pseudomonas alabamensis]|jgi:homoprotocatechuate degradation regulator HpaR|uniref:homoprotocatechuate degradation operon regulator HpaR n=1 Tax=Pseudomonas alabamensis TaxID=3064349 RepID=UPI003F651A9A
MTTPGPLLALTLLQAREATMAFFRPALNAHDLTEQQWRAIRILRQQGELENHRLSSLACLLRPSMSGVLKWLERDGLVARRKSAENQRRMFISLTVKGQQAFMPMSEEMERNYEKILSQFGEDKLQTLMHSLTEMKKIKP